MIYSVSKTGQGAFSVNVADNGRTVVTLDGSSVERAFDSAQAAYDYFRPMASTGDHACWNVCYTLEDVLFDATHPAAGDD